MERARRQHERRKARALAQVKERAEPLGDDGGVGGQLVPGKDLVSRELQHVGLHEGARTAEEERQVRGQLLGRVLVRRDAHERRAELAREPGQDMSPVPPPGVPWCGPGCPAGAARAPVPADRPRGAQSPAWAAPARRGAPTSRDRERLSPRLRGSTAALRRVAEARQLPRKGPRRCRHLVMSVGSPSEGLRSSRGVARCQTPGYRSRCPVEVPNASLPASWRPRDGRHPPHRSPRRDTRPRPATQPFGRGRARRRPSTHGNSPVSGHQSAPPPVLLHPPDGRAPPADPPSVPPSCGGGGGGVPPSVPASGGGAEPGGAGRHRHAPTRSLDTISHRSV